jgi:hypothetical protein
MAAIPALDWVYLDPADANATQAGELVSVEPGGMPIYRVVSLENGRAWLRDLGHGVDRLAALTDFHWKALPARS